MLFLLMFLFLLLLSLYSVSCSLYYDTTSELKSFIYSPILNSGDAITHNEKQMTSAKCKEDGSCYGTITYQWSLEKCPDQTSACTAISESQLNQMAETELSSMFFSARAFAYQADTWYRLFFRAYRTPTVYGEVSSLFFVNTGPKNGKSWLA